MSSITTSTESDSQDHIAKKLRDVQRPVISVHQRGPALLVSLTILVIVVFIVSLGIGAVGISPMQTIAILLNRIGINLNIAYEPIQENVLTQIRMPRIVLGLLVGASLGVAGTAIQGLFRNPLADPALIGISSGAALSAAIMIVFGGTIFHVVEIVLGQWALPAAAFGGGVVTTIAIYRLATRDGITSVPTMLLAGIAINALATAGVGILIFAANDEQLRDIAFWNLGSLGLADWDMIVTVTPLVIITVVPLMFLARALNALLLGEVEAEHLGYNTERLKQLIVILVALAVGSGVAVTGIIGFVGLIVPHLVRLMIGPDHRYVLPGSLLLGSALLMAADLLARTFAAPAEVPIGIVTALVGAPFFLYLLLRDRSRGRLM